eukprot:359872-Chlamydomonas_euryale.AAC.4
MRSGGAVGEAGQLLRFASVWAAASCQLCRSWRDANATSRPVNLVCVVVGIGPLSMQCTYNVRPFHGAHSWSFGLDEQLVY